MILMRYLFILVCLLHLGCSKEETFVPVYDVPDEFVPYVEAFLEEAEDRGIAITLNNLIIKFDPNLSVCGLCNHASLDDNVQKIISINPASQCWQIEEGKEALVFHELGHCVLGRPHNNELLPNGDPKSIMVYENTNLYWPCIYNVDGGLGPGCNNTFKREYYVDELFDETTPVPDWAK